jgi:poly(hydroxyalkanoate) depolymerase family esterase
VLEPGCFAKSKSRRALIGRLRSAGGNCPIDLLRIACACTIARTDSLAPIDDIAPSNAENVMAKLAPGVRLLRSLVRAGKSQRSILTKLIVAAAPLPSKARRKPAPKRLATPISPLAIRKHARPAIPPAPGRWLAAQFPLPGPLEATSSQRINYWLYLPERIPDTVTRDGWPLIVMLHGCHQSATQFAQGTRMNRLAEDKGYAVLYPQQLIRLQRHRCWRWYEQSVQHSGGETAVLVALIGTICRQYPIDRHRIYACGISAGAGMAAVLALNHPELIAAVALHSAPVIGVGHSAIAALRVMRHGAAAQADGAIHDLLQLRANQTSRATTALTHYMPALMLQGDDDKVVYPVNQQQLVRQWLLVNGFSPDHEARVITKPADRKGLRNAHEIRAYLVGRKVLLRSARIADLGHAWSGGDPALRFNAQRGPDASRLLQEASSLTIGIRMPRRPGSPMGAHWTRPPVPEDHSPAGLPVQSVNKTRFHAGTEIQEEHHVRYFNPDHDASHRQGNFAHFQQCHDRR